MSSQQHFRLYVVHHEIDHELVEKFTHDLYEWGIDAKFDPPEEIGRFGEISQHNLSAADGVLFFVAGERIPQSFFEMIGITYSLIPVNSKFIFSVVRRGIKMPESMRNHEVITWTNDYSKLIFSIGEAVKAFIEKRNSPPPAEEEQGGIGTESDDPQYWLMKLNPSTWPIDDLKAGEQTFSNTHYFGQKRPEYGLYQKLKQDDIVLGFATGDYQCVVCEMKVTQPVGPNTMQGEGFEMVITRKLEPPVPVDNIKDLIPQILPVLLQNKRPPEIFFPLTQTIYESILKGGNAPAPERSGYQPFYLTEGNHQKTDDQLDFENDINSFATVIALKKVDPPLAIGLFGNWGSGKSFFMEKLCKRIKEISESKDPEYIKDVVQVKFNSWHYSDSNLWASLITEIFDSLSRYLKQSEKENELQKISESLQITSMQKEVMEEKRKDLESQISGLEEEKKRKRERLEDLSGIRLVKLILSNDKIKKDLNELNNDNVENITADASKLRKYQEEISGTGNVIQYYLKFLGNLKGWRWPVIILLMVLVFITCYFIIPYVYPDVWEKGTLKVSGILSVIVAFIGNALALIRPVKKDLRLAFQRLESMKETLDKRPLDPDPELEAKKSNLEELKNSLKTINEKIESARKEISDIVTGKRLLDFIETRTRDENYTRQLGLISWIRKDFNMLDELLRKQHEVDDETKKSILNPKDVQLKVDRIILYIDDLDRCNENIVVKVLEAIHLLLAFPLFVVVVGVDPRWLNNALSEKYKLLFGARENGQASNGTQNHESGSGEELSMFAGGVATSYDYLEKIFQIPFALKPINKGGREKLIKYLIREEMFVPAVVPGNTSGTGKDKKINPGETKESAKSEGAGASQQVVTAEKETVKIVEKRKERLVFTKGELEYMQKISPLFGQTPRTINRYVNIYRIIKAHDNLKIEGEFDKDEYMPIMFLLAIIVGNSMHAEKLVEAMLKAADTSSFKEFYQAGTSFPKLKNLIDPFVPDIEHVLMESFKNNIELISRFSFRTLLKEV